LGGATVACCYIYEWNGLKEFNLLGVTAVQYQQVFRFFLLVVERKWVPTKPPAVAAAAPAASSLHSSRGSSRLPQAAASADDGEEEDKEPSPTPHLLQQRTKLLLWNP